jgi:hypothetical protein
VPPLGGGGGGGEGDGGGGLGGLGAASSSAGRETSSATASKPPRQRSARRQGLEAFARELSAGWSVPAAAEERESAGRYVPLRWLSVGIRWSQICRWSVPNAFATRLIRRWAQRRYVAPSVGPTVL